MNSVMLDILGRQHLEVLAKLDELEALLDRRGHQASFVEFVAWLDRDVGNHFRLEEEALFPLLARHLSETNGPLAVMIAEHSAFRDLQARLSRAVCDGDAAAQPTYAREILTLLRSHIAKEDHVLFPMAARLLGPDEWYEVGVLAAAVHEPTAQLRAH